MLTRATLDRLWEEARIGDCSVVYKQHRDRFARFVEARVLENAAKDYDCFAGDWPAVRVARLRSLARAARKAAEGEK